MAPVPLGIPIWTTLHSGALLGILHGEVPKPATGVVGRRLVSERAPIVCPAFKKRRSALAVTSRCGVLLRKSAGSLDFCTPSYHLPGRDGAAARSPACPPNPLQSAERCCPLFGHSGRELWPVSSQAARYLAALGRSGHLSTGMKAR